MYYIADRRRQHSIISLLPTKPLPSLAITKGSLITLPFILLYECPTPIAMSHGKAALQQIALLSLFHFELEVLWRCPSLGKWARDAFALVLLVVFWVHQLVGLVPAAFSGHCRLSLIASPLSGKGSDLSYYMNKGLTSIQPRLRIRKVQLFLKRHSPRSMPKYLDASSPSLNNFLNSPRTHAVGKMLLTPFFSFRLANEALLTQLDFLSLQPLIFSFFPPAIPNFE